MNPSAHKPALARLLVCPENHSAYQAVRHLLDFLASERPGLPGNPLVLHGPPGCGKTILLQSLMQDVVQRHPGLTVCSLVGRDLAVGDAASAVDSMPTQAASATEADLTIIEDLAQIPHYAGENLANILEERCGRDRPTICTARVGPGRLTTRQGPLPRRLISRLAAGLVIALSPWQPASRLRFLEEKAQSRQLGLTSDILRWLADELSGGRQLEGALAQLEALTRLQGRSLTLAEVQDHFRAHIEASRPDVERIAGQVEDYFQLPRGQLKSRRRFGSVLLARQVGMYLARRLTALSLQHIGAYFGGRDHATVLHACRKVERAQKDDAVLSGALCQLTAELA